MSTSPVHHVPAHAHTRPGAASRRFGYLVAAVLNALLLYLVNRRPGWEAVPFLTSDTTQVIGLVNASITAGLVANLVYVLWDPVWLRALGDLVTTSIGVLSMVRIWQVWPIDLSGSWEVLARVLVGIGIVGGMIGILASVVRFVQALSSPPPDR